MEDYIFMDTDEPKPNINMKKKAEIGDMRASSGSMGKGLKPDSVMDKVLAKIKEAESVLVALSNDPSVDEIAAAMGLSMALDAAGKHVTAIYSGKTPNVLEFLKPEERFETGTESLQDFVIALNKDKADHLRYKIDGDFVKVYVTPYKTTISGDDIEFSRGDYNVDLVISLNVPAATELDAALKEHGRIMHDATSVNITNGAAGKFGDVEWVEPSASSISEMVAKLAFEIDADMDAATATALLTGLVAATDRFKNPATTPDAMVLAAKLMGAGADQQLVVQNVQGEVVFDGGGGAKSVVVPEAEGEEESKPNDASKLEIAHGEEEPKDESEAEVETGAGKPVAEDESSIAETEEAKEEQPAEPVPNNADNDSVQAAMAEALNPAGATEAAAPTNGTVAGVDVAVVPENADGYAGETVADEILNNIEKENSNVGAADYGKMIDDALNEPLPGEGGIQVGAETPNGPQVNTQDVEKMEEVEALNVIKQAQAEANAPLPGMPANGELPKIIPGGTVGYEEPAGAGGNPAMISTPSMNGMSEVGGVPEMSFGGGNEMNGGMGMMNQAPMTGSMGMGAMNPMPMPGQEMTPPPVLPQPNFGEMPPAMPAEATIPVPEPAPAMPNVTVQPDASMAQPVNHGMVNAPMMGANGLPQMPTVEGAPMGYGNEAVGMQTGVGNFQSPEQMASNMNEASSDPSAFKIPGIHT